MSLDSAKKRHQMEIVELLSLYQSGKIRFFLKENKLYLRFVYPSKFSLEINDHRFAIQGA